MIKSGFFNSISHDRVYTAGDFAAYFGDCYTNGVVYAEPTSLQVIPGGGMDVNLMAGNAFINGYKVYNTSTLNIPLDAPYGEHSRIDRVVIRLDMSARSIYWAILKGVPSNAPVPAPLTRDGGIFELSLADVYVRAGAGAIEDGDILDTRLNPTLCGVSKTHTYLTYGEADTEGFVNKLEAIIAKVNHIEQNGIPIVKKMIAKGTYTRSGGSGKHVILVVTINNPSIKTDRVLIYSYNGTFSYLTFTHVISDGSVKITGEGDTPSGTFTPGKYDTEQTFDMIIGT
jgi:hypothetical protein